ncbi:MAG TPA: hypothetical protein VFJ30_08535 [Phycisphaerae bacterium]|nr:hypothetical protein [Phycisphaerae bacterium]
MNGARERSSIVVDTYTRCCLTAIAVLLAVVAIGLWSEAPVTARASAAAPDADSPGGVGNPNVQRQAIIRELNETNRNLSEILTLLKSGKLKVVMDKTEVKNESPKPKTPAPK